MMMAQEQTAILEEHQVPIDVVASSQQQRQQLSSEEQSKQLPPCKLIEAGQEPTSS